VLGGGAKGGVGLCFNGAALRGARKPAAAAEDPIFGLIASMGPRSEERGNLSESAFAEIWPRMLQWGRAPRSAETSRGTSRGLRALRRFNGAALRGARKRPRSRRISDAMLRFNGAALRGARKRRHPCLPHRGGELQWGRAPRSAETRTLRSISRRKDSLQWGRAPRSAETPRIVPLR